MNQVDLLGGRRERKPPRRLVEDANIAYHGDSVECNIVESLIQNVYEPSSSEEALDSKQFS